MPAAPQSAKRLFDGILTFSGGVDSGKSPTAATPLNPDGIKGNQISFAINATMRGGRVKPRSAYQKIDIGDFDQKTGRFQGAFAYQGVNGTCCLIASIDGHFLRFNVGSDNSVVDITPANDPNPSIREYTWFYQAENYLIGQDGQSKPFIFDGGVGRRAGQGEVPCGTVGAYSNGRIVQALENGITFAAGDLVYTGGTTASVLKFTENTFLNGGGFFTVPANSGLIRAMISMANTDTSLGQGPLLVLCDNTISSVTLPFDRTTWQNLQYPLQTISQVSYGGLSQYSTVVVNGDVFYRAIDGVRSYYVARRNFGQWANTPISREMNRIIAKDSQALLSHSSAVNFDNRLLMTASPIRTPQGTYHRALMSLDFDLISGMASKSMPAWEGIWTGLNVLQIVVGRFGTTERCFAFTLNSVSEIELWEIVPGGRFDLSPDESRIKWSLDFASYSFGEPFQLKRLESGDVWVDQVTGQVDFILKYRPDQHPCYFPWTTWNICSKDRDCDTEVCGVPIEYKPSYKPRKRFPTPDETCANMPEGFSTDGYEFQTHLDVEGYCEIKQFRLQAFERAQPMVGEC